MDIFKVCRLCFCHQNSSQMQSLFGDDGKLQTFFELCTNISLYEDRTTKVPALICMPCVNILNNCYKLRERARNIDMNIQLMKRTTIQQQSTSAPVPRTTSNLQGPTFKKHQQAPQINVQPQTEPLHINAKPQQQAPPLHINVQPQAPPVKLVTDLNLQVIRNSIPIVKPIAIANAAHKWLNNITGLNLKPISQMNLTKLKPLTKFTYNVSVHFSNTKYDLSGDLVLGSELKIFFPLQMTFKSYIGQKDAWTMILNHFTEGKKMNILNFTITEQSSALFSIFGKVQNFGWMNCRKKNIENIYLAAINSRSVVPAEIASKLGLTNNAYPNLYLAIILYSEPPLKNRRERFIPYASTVQVTSLKKLPFLRRNLQKNGVQVVYVPQYYPVVRSKRTLKKPLKFMQPNLVEKVKKGRVVKKAARKSVPKISITPPDVEMNNLMKNVKNGDDMNMLLDSFETPSTLFSPIDLTAPNNIDLTKPSTSKEVPAKLTCLICGITDFASLEDLDRHRESTHAKKVPQPMSYDCLVGPKTYSCMECSTIFTTRYAFKKHLQSHAHSDINIS